MLNHSGTSRHCLQHDSASSSLFQRGSSLYCPQRCPDGYWKLRGSENALCWTSARWMDTIREQEPEWSFCWTRLRISTESAGGTCAHTQDLVSVRNSHTLSKKKKRGEKGKNNLTQSMTVIVRSETRNHAQLYKTPY